MKETEEKNWEWVDISLIKTDGQNPNYMSEKQKEALKRNIQKYGWNMPIIVDMDYLIADGEQKLTVAREMDLKKVPVLRKELTDTDRRIIRQSMNKISGVHSPELDADEFKRILEGTDMENFVNLTGQSEQYIMNLLSQEEKEERQLIKEDQTYEKLNFEKVGDDYSVTNKKGEFLGRLQFHKPWKKWIWNQDKGAIMAMDCLQELITFTGTIG